MGSGHRRRSVSYPSSGNGRVKNPTGNWRFRHHYRARAMAARAFPGACSTATASWSPAGSSCTRTGWCRTSMPRPQGDDPGGSGVSVGTDILARWRWRRESSFVPYVEAGGGIQYAFGTAFPAHGSDLTFTINAGIGAVVALESRKQLDTGCTLPAHVERRFAARQRGL